jgi:hypothetical protein
MVLGTDVAAAVDRIRNEAAATRPKESSGERSHRADANPPRRPLTHRTLGVTGFDGAEVAPVPTAFVAVTVKV